MAYLYKLLRFTLLTLFLFTGSMPFGYTQVPQQPQLEEWQEFFLDEVERHYQRGHPAREPQFEDYARLLQGFEPEALLRVVEQSVTLRPYRGSMVEPAAVLMGGSSNSLDRARLLAALVEFNGHEARIVYSERPVAVSYPGRTPPSLQTVPRSTLAAVEKLVQRDSPKLFRRLCPSQQSCTDWPPETTSSPRAFWVQVNQGSGWMNLLPGDTEVTPQAMAAMKVLSGPELQGLGWIVRVEITNSYGDAATQKVLSAELSAARLHAKAISFDNLPQDNGFLPVLSIDGEAPRAGQFFALSESAGALRYQQLHVELQGPGESWRYSRLLAVPNPAASGLEMVTRARLTVTTGPVWTEYSEYLQTRTMDRLANLLHAPDNKRDDSPANFTSFRALTLLALSYRFAGHVGITGPVVYSYQARPAVIVERIEATEEEGTAQLLSSFDLVDMGHAIDCRDCTVEQRQRAAVEQGLVDAFLEDALFTGIGGTSSHRLTQSLISSGDSLGRQPPRYATWPDLYNR